MAAISRLGGEGGLQIVEIVGVDGDAVPLHDAEHGHHRQFHVGQQRLLAERVQVLLERAGQVDDRPGLDHVPGVDVPRGVLVLVRDQRELLLGVDLVLGVQGAVQVALHQVAQVEGGCPGRAR